MGRFWRNEFKNRLGLCSYNLQKSTWLLYLAQKIDSVFIAWLLAKKIDSVFITCTKMGVSILRTGPDRTARIFFLDEVLTLKTFNI